MKHMMKTRERQMASEKLSEDNLSEIITGKTGKILYTIYYDTNTGLYYYPIEALTERIQEHRIVSVDKPEFLYNRKSKLHMDANSGDLYMEFDNPEIFRETRKDMLVKINQQEHSKNAKSTKVYLDERNGYYYYPDMAMWEPLVVERDVIKRKKASKIPVKFNSDQREFTHVKTGKCREA